MMKKRKVTRDNYGRPQFRVSPRSPENGWIGITLMRAHFGKNRYDERKSSDQILLTDAEVDALVDAMMKART